MPPQPTPPVVVTPPTPALLAAGAARRAGRARGTLELELRLGRVSSGRSGFVPGVDRRHFENLERDLVESHLDADRTWEEHVDVCHTDPDGRRLRTRVVYDADRFAVDTTHTLKERRVDTLFRGDDDATAAVRVAVSEERPADRVPDVCVPSYVRIQQRRSFRDVRDGAVVWSYELSRTWGAPTQAEAEELHHTAPPTYEVECELVDERGAYLASHTDAQVARSLLVKAALLLGTNGPLHAV